MNYHEVQVSLGYEEGPTVLNNDCHRDQLALPNSMKFKQEVLENETPVPFTGLKDTV